MPAGASTKSQSGHGPRTPHKIRGNPAIRPSLCQPPSTLLVCWMNKAKTKSSTGSIDNGSFVNPFLSNPRIGHWYPCSPLGAAVCSPPLQVPRYHTPYGTLATFSGPPTHALCRESSPSLLDSRKYPSYTTFNAPALYDHDSTCALSRLSRRRTARYHIGFQPANLATASPGLTSRLRSTSKLRASSPDPATPKLHQALNAAGASGPYGVLVSRQVPAVNL